MFKYSNILIYIFAIDQDTLSEREFACPAKRRKQQEFVDDEVVQLRQQNGRSGEIEFRLRVDVVDPMDAITKR